MNVFLRRFYRLFQPTSPVPAAYRTTFLHLYGDISWFGLLSGTTIAFLAVYATRQGASTEQIGLLTAVPGLVNLVFALPAGSWLGRRSIGHAVFWTSILQRMFYLVLVPLPILLLPKTQVWTIITITLVMNIPGTAMVVGFNTIFGEVVPIEYRGYVVGIRNALLSIITTVFTLISGVILNQVSFPMGYQIVFAMGVLGAGMSSLHLFFLARIVSEKKGALPSNGEAVQRSSSFDIRSFYQRGLQTLRLDAMRGPFAKLMALLFGWHLFQFMTIPIITPFVVNQLHVTDQVIGYAGSLFNAMVFIGSLQLNRATTRFGNKMVTGVGIMGLSLFPIVTSFGAHGYLIANVIGGFAWSMAGGALYNYILENVPAGDGPAYLAWYSVVSNGAILVGSLAGPAGAALIGFAPALVLFGIGRFLAGAAIVRWG